MPARLEGFQASTTTARATSFTANYPANCQPGDYLVLAAANCCPSDYADPSGWYSYYSNKALADVWLKLWVRVVGPNEPTTVALAQTGTNSATASSHIAFMARYSNVGTGLGGSGVVSSASSFTSPAPGALTLGAEDMAIHIYAYGNATQNTWATSLTAPTTGGWATRYNSINTTGGSASGWVVGLIYQDLIGGSNLLTASSSPQTNNNYKGAWVSTRSGLRGGDDVMIGMMPQ